MNYFLVKTEPSVFSLQDLKREGETVWDGVHSLAAIAVIKAWKKGDRLLVYHSGIQKAIVGMAVVVSDPFQNPSDKRYSWAAKVKFVQQFSNPELVSLDKVKECGKFDNFALVRQGRLSVMKCPEQFVGWVKNQLGIDI